VNFSSPLLFECPSMSSNNLAQDKQIVLGILEHLQEATRKVPVIVVQQYPQSNGAVS